jgi:hypothetical protein
MTGWIALCSVLLSGCWQKSVHPFFTEADVVTRPEIVGTFLESEKGKEGKEGDVMRFVFTHPGGKQYLLKIEEDDESWEFDVHLFRLGESEFMNLFSQKRGVSEIPAHHLFKFMLKGDALELLPLNPDWIRENKSTLDHITVPNAEAKDNYEVILTGKTPALQKMVRANLKNENFFTDAIVLQRQLQP